MKNQLPAQKGVFTQIYKKKNVEPKYNLSVIICFNFKWMSSKFLGKQFHIVPHFKYLM